jgi:hypothetical protein
MIILRPLSLPTSAAEFLAAALRFSVFSCLVHDSDAVLLLKRSGLVRTISHSPRFARARLSMSTIIDSDVLKKIDGIEGVWVPEIQIELETD